MFIKLNLIILIGLKNREVYLLFYYKILYFNVSNT